jgi:DNA mismatch repair protein MutS
VVLRECTVYLVEREGRVVFLYAVQPGPADRAYGIQVARLAGLPPWVADRAEILLMGTPRRFGPETAPQILIAEEAPPWPQQAEPPREPAPTPAQHVATALRDLDLDEMTPRQALTWLWEQQERLLEETGEPSPPPWSAGSRMDQELGRIRDANGGV